MSVFIIAEAGVNHNGDIALARKLIDAAKNACCDAVKFQSFKADRLVTKTAGKAQYQIENTNSAESQYEMLKKLELSYNDHAELISYCRENNITFISTPFDEESADMLDNLGITVFKISSGDITDKHLLKHVAKKQKPVILSTGMSTLEEVEEALQWIYGEGNRNVTLLHCTSCYPAAVEDVNLNAIKALQHAFKVKVGYSDHTPGVEIPAAAVALGAEVIEKHITLDKSMPGPDHKVSLEPDELSKMVRYIRNIEKALGDGRKYPVQKELDVREAARKYIVTNREIYKGQVISYDMLCVKRAGKGIEPKQMDSITGSVALKDLAKGYALQPGDFNKCRLTK